MGALDERFSTVILNTMEKWNDFSGDIKHPTMLDVERRQPELLNWYTEGALYHPQELIWTMLHPVDDQDDQWVVGYRRGCLTDDDLTLISKPLSEERAGMIYGQIIDLIPQILTGNINSSEMMIERKLLD